MKKAKRTAPDEIRPQYRRADFPALVRGKYLQRLRKSSNVVVLEPGFAGLFPNAAAVNAALRSMVEIGKRSASQGRGSR
jgi:hypothetical protein